jgi:PleD family two-component response regulator
MHPPSTLGPGSASRRISAPFEGRDMSHLLPLNNTMKASVRILVIDDERVLRDSCATALRFEGYQVEVCGRG